MLFAATYPEADDGLGAAGREAWRPAGEHTGRTDDVTLRWPVARHALRGGDARRGAEIGVASGQGVHVGEVELRGPPMAAG